MTPTHTNSGDATAPKRGTVIGEMNGPWALVFRIALATYPLLLAWCIWVTVQTFESKAFREHGGRFTTTDAEMMRREFDAKLAALPPAEWKARIIKIEDNQFLIMQGIAVIREKIDQLTKETRGRP